MNYVPGQKTGCSKFNAKCDILLLGVKSVDLCMQQSQTRALVRTLIALVGCMVR